MFMSRDMFTEQGPGSGSGNNDRSHSGHTNAGPGGGVDPTKAKQAENAMNAQQKLMQQRAAAMERRQSLQQNEFGAQIRTSTPLGPFDGSQSLATLSQPTYSSHHMGTTGIDAYSFNNNNNNNTGISGSQDFTKQDVGHGSHLDCPQPSSKTDTQTSGPSCNMPGGNNSNNNSHLNDSDSDDDDVSPVTMGTNNQGNTNISTMSMNSTPGSNGGNHHNDVIDQLQRRRDSETGASDEMVGVEPEDEGLISVVPDPKSPQQMQQSEMQALQANAQNLESSLQRRGLATVFDPTMGANGNGPQYVQHGTTNVRRFDPTLIGNDLQAFLTNPIPKGVLMECHVNRSGSFIGSFFPKYILSTDSGMFLLAGQKRKKNKTSNYIISMSDQDLNRDSPNCVAKLRSNFMGSEFIVYNGGVNPDKVPQSSQTDVIREELCAVTYCSTIWGKKPRGPRRMTAALPKIVNNDADRLVCRPLKNDGTCGLLSASKLVLDNVVTPEESPVEILVNKPPKWNEHLGAFVLNFNKRVTQASVKNFQLISKRDPDTVVLQFGRVGKDVFNMDFRHPLSPAQAFAIVLSSFDYKLCCE